MARKTRPPRTRLRRTTDRELLAHMRQCVDQVARLEKRIGRLTDAVLDLKEKIRS
jgi:hypothetical protein